MQKVQELIRVVIQYGWDRQSAKEIALLWKPQARECVSEDPTSNKVIGMMTDKGSLVWVIKKSIGETAFGMKCLEITRIKNRG